LVAALEGLLSADLHKQICILQGAKSFTIRINLLSKIKPLKIRGVTGPIRKI
jgi:hypothetical protein